MKVIEMLLGDKEEFGVFTISLVEEPAIEEDYIALSKELVELKTLSEEQKIVVGAVLIPDKKILRKDKAGNPFYMFMTKETIKEASERFMINGFQSKVNLEHSKKVEDVTVVETWLTGKSDKSMDLGLRYPVGTWMVAMKVNNEEVWNDYVKTGKLKGFSIEGYFEPRKEEEKTEQEERLARLKQILQEN